MALHPDTVPPISYRPAVEYGFDDLVGLLNRGFKDYFVNINFSRDTILAYLARDNVDLCLSQVAVVDSAPVAIGLIARRGWSVRLAAMSVLPELRGQGIGKKLLKHLDACLASQGLREFVLEVIEQNHAAVKLYQGAGFETIRRLVGFSRDGFDSTDSSPSLREVDIAEVARKLTADSVPNLPWQLSGTSLMVGGPPYQAYQLGDAAIVISDPGQPTLSIRAIFVEPAVRRQGHGSNLVAAILARFPDHHWAVSALCPEELGGLFIRNGFQIGELSQLQMSRKI